MPLAASAALILALLIVCCFAPGFFVVRRLRWTPMEKLCGSTGLSVILLYLVTWFTYLGGGGVQISAGIDLDAASPRFIAAPPFIPSEACAPRIRISLYVGAIAARNDSRLFGSTLGRGLAGALSKDTLFPLAISRGYIFYRPIYASGSSSSNECRRGIFPRADGRPL